MMLRVICVCLILLSCGVVYAQLSPTADQAWLEQVDLSTPWGQWLSVTARPYLESLAVILTHNINSMHFADKADVSREQAMAELRSAYEATLNEYQFLKPPPELKKYHALVIELYKQLLLIHDYTDYNESVFKDIQTRMNQEMRDVFKEQGIPPSVINGFLARWQP